MSLDDLEERIVRKRPAITVLNTILADTLPNHITLFDLAVDPPALWNEQRERVGL